MIIKGKKKYIILKGFKRLKPLSLFRALERERERDRELKSTYRPPLPCYYRHKYRK